MNDDEDIDTSPYDEPQQGRRKKKNPLRGAQQKAEDVSKMAKAGQNFFDKRASKNKSKAIGKKADKYAKKAANASKHAQRLGKLATKAQKVANMAAKIGKIIVTVGWIILIILIIIGLLVFILTGLRIYYEWVKSYWSRALENGI